ncbi:MAG: hypothetical protein ACJ72D_27060 [Marmoricola sp.]
MRKSFAAVPVGVWAGFVVILLGAWAQDGWGILLGAIIVVVTMITTSREPEAKIDPSAENDPDAGSELDSWPGSG